MHKLCGETQVSAAVGLEQLYMSATQYSDVLKGGVSHFTLLPDALLNA